MKPKTYFRRLLMDIATIAPARAILIVILMAVSSFFEGFALTMLFPLLSFVGFSGDGELGGVTERIVAIMAKVGIGMSLPIAAGLLVLMVAFQHACLLIALSMAAGLQAGFIARWRQKLTDAFLKTEWLYFTRENTGALSHIFGIETRRAGDLINHGTQAVSLGFTAIVYLLAAFIISWKVTLILMIGGAAILAFSQLMVHRPAQMTAYQVKLFTLFTSQSSEILSGMKLIRAVNGGDAVRRLLLPTITALRKIERKVIMQPAILRACFELSAIVALMGTLVLVTNLSVSDGATVVLIAALFVRLYPRVSTVQQFIHQFRMSLPYYAAVIDVLDKAQAAAEPPDSHGAIVMQPDTPPTVTLQGVGVSYDDRPALRDVSLSVPSRQTVAIVGPSGAGKSTLVDTLLRLVPIREGTIEVDGVNLNEIDMASWRKSVGYVPQDTFLFNASIRDNIAFAQPDASRDEIREAARKAHLMEFIENLPDGYDTIVGDRGVMLSGGQRQRIGIARALIGGRSLLILDEATAALDSETESAIMRDISDLHGQITIILIAHRLSTLRAADKIFVLDQGQLAETGSWASLIDRGGLFQKLWDIQTEIPSTEHAIRQST